jgi:amino acid transporter
VDRRRLVDFVSPAMLIVAALVNIAFFAFVLYSYQRLELPLFKVVVSIACVALALLMFSVTVSIDLRARKLDPYLAHQDRHNLRKLVVQQALAYRVSRAVRGTADHQALRVDHDKLVRAGDCAGIAGAVLLLSNGQGRL